MGAKFMSGGGRVHQNPTFGGVVVAVHRGRVFTFYGSDIDDGSTAALGYHSSGGRLRAEKSATQVAVNHQIPFFFRHIYEQAQRV